MVTATETPAQSGRTFTPTYPTGAHPGIRCTRSETCRRKGTPMQVPSILQGDSLKRLPQGAFIGFLATVIIGFGWGGWTLGSTAKELAEKSASSAAIAALAPICVDKFQRAAGAEANLVELRKVSCWQQTSFVEKGGWATLPGSDVANSSVARACADMLANLK